MEITDFPGGVTEDLRKDIWSGPVGGITMYCKDAKTEP